MDLENREQWPQLAEDEERAMAPRQEEGAQQAPRGKKAEIEAAKNKYGDVYGLEMEIQPDDETTVEIWYIFRAPKTADYDRYVKEVSQSVSRASKNLALGTVIEEHRAKLEADLERFPALPIGISDKLLAKLGLGKGVNFIKL